ncbi:MAG: dephospho-CoA kinase [Coriobacteriia bacterium]|nr:dephospho-CoA kinase [Coriobacteriia bacterium]
MYVIAVTGGIGAGKSLASEYFRSRGAIVLDLDEIAHQVIAPGGPAYNRIVERFGPEVLCPDGTVDRSALAKIVFSDEDSLTALNKLVHPVVLREVVEGITSMRLLEQPPRVVVLEVPLLAKAPIFADVADTVLAIEAPVELRLRRCVEAGRETLDASRRIARQATDEERAVLAQHVIKNTGTRKELLCKLAAYWDEVAPLDA